MGKEFVTLNQSGIDNDDGIYVILSEGDSGLFELSGQYATLGDAAHGFGSLTGQVLVKIVGIYVEDYDEAGQEEDDG